MTSPTFQAHLVETARFDSGTTITQFAREVAQVPVITNGGMHRPSQAARALRERHGDVVSLGRGALTNPDWPKRLAERRTLDAFDPDALRPDASLDEEFRSSRRGSPCPH